MSEHTTDILSSREHNENAVASLLQLVPCVGGALSQSYFGLKQARQFKRLDNLYHELADELKGLKRQIPDTGLHDESSLISIIEQIHEKVEAEPIAEKRDLFRRYYRNTLLDPVTAENYDERKYFLHVLDEMTERECTTLASLARRGGRIKVTSLIPKGGDGYAALGAINRLKSYGFLAAFRASFMMTGQEDERFHEELELTRFGRRFCQFCLSD